MIGPREPEHHRSDRHRLLLVDGLPGERVAPVSTDEGAETITETRRRVDGQPATFQAVPHQHMKAVHVDAVVGMLVADHDRGEIFDLDVALKMPEGAVAAVEPDRRRAVAEQVSAARLPVRPAVGPGAAEHRQLHDQASTAVTSGPRNRAPSRRNCSTSPRVRNVRRAGWRGAPPESGSISRTANAVSSALETRMTSLPMTSVMVRASKG